MVGSGASLNHSVENSPNKLNGNGSEFVIHPTFVYVSTSVFYLYCASGRKQIDCAYVCFELGIFNIKHCHSINIIFTALVFLISSLHMSWNTRACR